MSINITEAQIQGWIQDGIRTAIEEAGRGFARRQPAEEPVVAKEFGGLNYGVETIWRKVRASTEGNECRGCF